MPVGNPRAEAGAIACLTLLLLSVAIWNGFPIIYYDTGAYVLEGLGRHFLIERAPAYSLFLRFAGAGTSLWLVALVQCLCTAFVMTEAARAVVPRFSLGAFVALGAALCVGTGLPWYAAQIEPDCFTGILMFAVYLIAFRAQALGRVRWVMLTALGALAAAVHPSHLLLAAALLAVLVAAAVAHHLTRRANVASSTPHLAGPALVVLLGLGLVVASNYDLTGQVFVTRAGPSFLFGRLLQDRIVIRLLDDTCPHSGYRLCAYKDELPRTADGWLWTPKSPFFALGGFSGTAAESERIVRDSLARYPWLHLRWAVIDTARQFASFRTGDQIEPQQWAIAPVLKAYIPGQMADYLAARQQKGEMDFHLINFLHVPVGGFFLFLTALALAGFMPVADRRSMTMLAFLVAALLANAAICGTFSGPHDRYQSRLLWTVPFLVALAFAEGPVRALRESGESGTD